MYMAHKIDEKDSMILEALEQDSRQSTSAIARKTRIPRVTVHKRIQRMRKLGIIRRFTVDINYDSLGYADSAYMFITFRNDRGVSEWKLAEKLASLPFVHSVSAISGQYDFIMHVRSASIKSLGETIVQRVSPLTGVDKITTMACYRTFPGRFKI